MIPRMRLLLIFFILSLNTLALEIQSKKVLILNSYHPQYKWTQEVTTSLKKSFEKKIPEENIFIEFLDARRFINDKNYLKEVTRLFSYKFRDRYSPDIVITIDDYAFQFVLKHGESIFHNIPIVFGGVNVFEQNMLKNTKNITGILEGSEIPKNLELIQKQRPKLDKLYVISDKSIIGKELTKVAIDALSYTNINYSLLNNFTFQELEEILRNGSENSAALILAVHADRNGRYFSYTHELERFSKISSIPIYGMWGMTNGHGILGGYMTDGFIHGQEIFHLAFKILSGDSIEDHPVRSKTQFVPQFDYNQLKRFNMSMDTLPFGSVVINTPENFIEKYRFFIIVSITLVMGLLVVIFVLNQMVKSKTQHLDILNAKLKEFVGIVAHDLRNPISSMISLSDIILQGHGESKEILPVIRNLAKNSLDLVSDILELSAIESGRIKIVMKETNLFPLIKDIETQMRLHASKKKIILKANILSDVYVYADEKRISQVLQNLINNAIKFSHENGEVLINVAVSNKVEISVSDNGIGIPQELVQKLFLKTAKTSRSGTAGEPGTGYGLPLAYEIIKLHGSKLICNSEEAIGSTFSFSLSSV